MFSIGLRYPQIKTDPRIGWYHFTGLKPPHSCSSLEIHKYDSFSDRALRYVRYYTIRNSAPQSPVRGISIEMRQWKIYYEYDKLCASAQDSILIHASSVAISEERRNEKSRFLRRCYQKVLSLEVQKMYDYLEERRKWHICGTKREGGHIGSRKQSSEKRRFTQSRSVREGYPIRHSVHNL